MDEVPPGVLTTTGGSPCAGGKGSVTPSRRPAARAAPSATACLGCTSIATGRPNSAATNCPTNGIRELPPTNNTAANSPADTPAATNARPNTAVVSANGGRIIDSNSERVKRISVCTDGNNTGIDTSVSADNASFAATQSARNRANAATTTGSDTSNPLTAAPKNPNT